MDSQAPLNAAQYLELWQLFLDHKWAAIGLIVIGGLVRLTKPDAAAFPDMDARWRPWLSLVLGLAAALCTAFVRHIPLGPCLVDGFIAGGGPVLIHQLFVEGIRNGRDFFTPKKPGSLPINPLALGVFIVFFVSVSLGAVTAGCGAGAKGCAMIDIAEQACNVLPIRYLTPDGKTAIVQVRRDEFNEFGHKMAAQRAYEMKAGAEPLSCDGGCADR